MFGDSNTCDYLLHMWYYNKETLRYGSLENEGNK